MVNTPHLCEICVARTCGLCGALSAHEIAQLRAIGLRRRLSAGEVLTLEDGSETYVANILLGMIKLVKSLPDGREQIVGLLFSGDFVGEPFLNRSGYRAVAVTDVLLCSYHKGQFETLARGRPELEHKLFVRFLSELDRARDWVLLLGQATAAERVARALLFVAERVARVAARSERSSQPMRFQLALSRVDLASFLGLRAETVSRQLRSFSASGIIAIEAARTIEICDYDRLVAISGVRG